MHVGKLTAFLRRLADALASNDALHAAEGCRIAADIVERSGELERENRRLRKENEELEEENSTLASALHRGCQE